MQKKEKEESKESTEAIFAQIQMAEQFLQNLMMQKQLFQSEFVETENALEELKKIKNNEVFKIIGSIMFKSDKEELEKELEKKKNLLNLRLKTLDKQEEELKEKVLKQRDELLKNFKQ